MAQWEMCRAALETWLSEINFKQEWDTKIVLDYYSPIGDITRFVSIKSWGQVLAILGAAEWEAITIQPGFGDVQIDHPIRDKHPDGRNIWQFHSCSMVAYFKRPMQAGRNIDDAL